MPRIKNPVGLISRWADDEDLTPEEQVATAAAMLETGLHLSAGEFGRFIDFVYSEYAQPDEEGNLTLVVEPEFLA